MTLFTHLSAFFKSLLRPYPARDWFLALVATFFIFFALVSYGVYLYSAISSGSIFTAGDNNAVPQLPVTRADMNAVLETYTAREALWNSHSIVVPPVTDPR